MCESGHLPVSSLPRLVSVDAIVETRTYYGQPGGFSTVIGAVSAVLGFKTRRCESSHRHTHKNFSRAGYLAEATSHQQVEEGGRGSQAAAFSSATTTSFSGEIF